jgi:hypothetical protein
LEEIMSQRVILLAGTIKGLFIFESDVNRQSWKVRGPLLGGWEVYGVRGDSRHGHRIFAGTSHLAYGPSIRLSEDFGETWQELEKGPSYAPETGFKLNRIWQIVPGHESQPDTYFAGVDEAGVFVSRDRGLSWQELDGLTKHPSRPGWFPGAGGMCLHTILVHPTNPQRMWVAASAIGVFRSEDGGETWQARNTGLGHAATGQPQEEVGYCVHKMELDPENPDVLYMQEHTGVFMSTDGADSWFPIEAGLPADRIQHPEMMPFGFPIVVTRNGDQFLVPLESAEQRTVKGGKLLVYRRQRDAERWEPSGDVAPDEPHHVSVLRDAMTTDGLEQEGIYFGTTSGELYLSMDRGEEWQRLPGQYSRILNVKTWVIPLHNE